MSIHFQPRLPNSLPNVPRPTVAGPETSAAGTASAVPLGRSSEPTNPVLPTASGPAARLDALVQKIQERLDRRMERGDLDREQVQGLSDLLRTFQGAMTGLGESATEGSMSHREIAAGVKEALAAMQSGVEDILDPDEDRPGAGGGGLTKVHRNGFEGLSPEPYSALDQEA